MRKGTLIILIICVVLLGCNNNSFVNLSFQKSTNRVLFDLFPAAKHDTITFGIPQGKGSIYFETKKGKHWLSGKPLKTKSSKMDYQAEWIVNNRKVIISFEKGKSLLGFSFKAEPDTGIISWGMNIKADDREFFAGLFERTVDGKQTNSWKEGIKETLDLRGQKINLLIESTLGLYAPFYISSKGYGLYIEGTWPVRYDFCKSDPQLVQINYGGNIFSGKFYCSSNPAEIVKAHALETGPSIMPPRWAFRPQRWRDAHINNNTYFDGAKSDTTYNSMLVEDILMMEALDIPLGAYWIDRPWGKGSFGYDDFEWDDERFPNNQEMIQWLRAKDINLIVWISPWVDGEMAETARERNFDLPFRDPDSTGVPKWKEEALGYEIALLDFTNPKAVEWWQNEGVAKLLKQGVKGFKMDRADELVPYSDSVRYYNGKTATEMRNAFPVYYTKAAHDIAQKINGDDFLLMPRAGYTGSSKYASVWGGDIASPQEGLRCAILAIQKASIMGYPVWGSDIGGYWGGKLDREVTARWLAFGCFNPIMEFGPTENLAPWSMKTEPHYDTTLIAIWRMYSILHDKLADYSHHQSVEANKTGMPIVRPLFLEYPEQEKAWEDWQTFSYGPDILVSAIWRKGKTKHLVYLPSGCRWKDAWESGKIYEGGSEIEINAPIYKIPIFIKEGSKVDLGNLNSLYQESLVKASKKPQMIDLIKIFQ